MCFQPRSYLQALSWKNYERSCLHVNIKNHSQYPVVVIHKRGRRIHALTPSWTPATPKRQALRLDVYLVKYQIPCWCLWNEGKNSTLLRWSHPFISLNRIPWLSERHHASNSDSEQTGRTETHRDLSHRLKLSLSHAGARWHLIQVT